MALRSGGGRHKNREGEPIEGHGRRFTDDPSGPTSLVTEQMVLKGEARGSGSLELQGTLEGSCTLGGRVVVRPQGCMVGDVQAKDVLIEGEVRGDVTAKRSIELRATSKVSGDLSALSIAMAEGCYFEGSITMTADPDDGDLVMFKEQRASSP